MSVPLLPRPWTLFRLSAARWSLELDPARSGGVALELDFLQCAQPASRAVSSLAAWRLSETGEVLRWVTVGQV